MNLSRFLQTYGLACLGICALVLVVQVAFELDFANAGTSVVPVMLAAMLEGQRFVRTQGEMPSPALMWRFARRAALYVVAIGAVLTFGLSFVLPELSWLLTHGWGLVAIVIILLVTYLLSLMIIRQFLGMGAKIVMKDKGRKGRGA